MTYLFESSFVKKQIIQGSKKTTVFVLSQSSLKKIKIPIPSLQEQQEIVDKLDVFRNITESFEDGIPALIEKCQKQYMFYKEQLLSY